MFPNKQLVHQLVMFGSIWISDNLFLCWELRIYIYIYDILMKTSSIRLLYLLFYSSTSYSHNPIYLQYRGYWKTKALESIFLLCKWVFGLIMIILLSSCLLTYACMSNLPNLFSSCEYYSLLFKSNSSF